MSNDKEKTGIEATEAAMDGALTRLERAVLNRKSKGKSDVTEQAIYIEQLESKNKQMSRDLADMKKHCLALKSSYELLENKCQKLEYANDSAEKELANTLRDLDHMIAQKSLH